MSERLRKANILEGKTVHTVESWDNSVTLSCTDGTILELKLEHDYSGEYPKQIIVPYLHAGKSPTVVQYSQEESRERVKYKRYLASKGVEFDVEASTVDLKRLSDAEMVSHLFKSEARDQKSDES